MAFSLNDKKNLLLMIENPNNFFELIKENIDLLNSLQNKYFKDGSGIYHLLLNKIQENDSNIIYKEILYYIISLNSKFNLFQNNKNHDNALNQELSNSLLNNDNKKFILSLLSKSNKENNITNIKTICNILEKYNFIEDKEILIEFYKNNIYLHELTEFQDLIGNKIIDFIIKEHNLNNKDNQINNIINEFSFLKESDNFLINFIRKGVYENFDLNYFQILIEDDKIKNHLNVNLKFFNFFFQDMNQFDLNLSSSKYKYNIYSFICKNYKKEKFLLLKFFGDNFNELSFNGLPKVNHNFLPINNNQSHLGTFLLNQVTNNKIDNLKSVFYLYKNASLNEQLDWLSLRCYTINNVAEVFENFYKNNINENQDYNLNNYILSQIPSFFHNNNIKEEIKLLILSDLLLYSDTNLKEEYIKNENKFNTTLNILEKIEDFIPKNKEFEKNLYNLFLNIPKEGLQSTKEINDFFKIYKILKNKNLFQFNPIFMNEGLLNTPNLLYKFLEKNETITEIKNTEDYCNLNNPFIKFFNINCKHLNIDNAIKSLNILHDRFPDLIYNKHVFTNMIVKNNIIFNTFINDDILKNLIKKYDNETLQIKLNQENKENIAFNLLTKKLINNNYYFKNFYNNNNIDIISLLNFLDKDNLKNLIEKNNININDYQNDIIFWIKLDSKSNFEKIQPYFKSCLTEQQINICNKYLLSEEKKYESYINFSNLYPIVLELKDISNNNSLHISFLNCNYKAAEYLLKNNEILAKEKNNAKKLPIEYFLKQINTELKKNNRFSLELLKEQSNLLKLLIDKTFSFQKKEMLINKKVETFINNEKFVSIFPDIHYYYLNTTIKKNEDVVKKRRNKI